MVLIDTSVWIRGLQGVSPFHQHLDGMLAENSVAAHELVYGELLIGDRGGRKHFLDFYAQLPKAPVLEHAHVVELVRARRLHGRGAGWIDIHLLASALAAGFRFWTADPRLAEIARELRVGYQGI